MCSTRQIFGYLGPMDLLNLARSSKDFRSFLMKRSSAMIWKVSQLNVEEFPPCPADMSEPAYANLMFDAHCHVSIICYIIY